jgi:pSer/pThr/pTyr-binding forkhead associated (FHA) protein
MHDSPRPPEGPSLPARPAAAAEAPATFVPLRLLLQPGGLCVELNRPEMLIGRHSTADVRLCLPDISRRHCRFVFSDGRWEVFDLNSLNGIFVNGAHLQESVLEHGDVVRIGSLTFRVDLRTATDEENSDVRVGVLRSIADVLPNEPERRKAS